ncbi:glycosyltransferase family 2 protein, partial [Streptococcus suis]
YYEFKNNQKVTVNTNLKIKRLMLGTLAVFPSWKWWRRRVLSLGNPISCPAVTYNLEKLSDFQFDPEMKVSIDWFAWAEIAKKK